MSKQALKSAGVLLCSSLFYLILMIWLILIGWLNETLAQTITSTSPPKNVNEQEQNLRIVTNEVRLPLRAFDPVGGQVTDLTAKEVFVIEDGVACQVTSLKRESANIMIVLDLSSPLEVFKSRLEDTETSEKLFEGPNYTVLHRPIAREYAEILMRHFDPQDHIAIVQYADKVEMLQDWTRNREEAIRALRAGFQAGLKARFYDALTLAAAQLQNTPAGRRVLMLVTDGLDSASVSAKYSAFEKVMATGASIYVVSWTKIIISEARSQKKRRNSLGILSLNHGGELKRYSEQADRATEELKTLAEKSGGEFWLPLTVSDFALKKPRTLVSQIDSEYTLTYLSPKDQIDRIANIPEIYLTRPGVSVFTRRAIKSNSEAR